MKFKPIGVLSLLLFSALIFLAPSIPFAHATGPSVGGTIASSNSGATPQFCVTGLLSLTSGDQIVLTVSGEYSAAGQNYSSAPADLVGTTSGWHRIKFVTVTGSSSLVGGTYTAWAGAFVATSTSTGNHEVSISYNSGTSNNHWRSWCGLTDMVGLPSTNYISKSFTCYNTCSASVSTPAINYQPGVILIATGAVDTTDDVDNFQLKTTVSPAFTGLSGMCLTTSQNNCAQYFVPTGSGSTTFPMASTWMSSNIQAEVSVEFGTTPPPTFTGAINNLDCGNCVIADNGKFYNFVMNMSTYHVSGMVIGNFSLVYLEFNDTINNYIVQYNFANNSATIFKGGTGGISLGQASVITKYDKTSFPGTPFQLANLTIPIQFNNAVVNSQLRSIYLEACILPATGPGVCTSFTRIQTNYFSILVNGAGLVNTIKKGNCAKLPDNVFSSKCTYQSSPRSSIQTNSTWVYLESYDAQFAVKLNSSQINATGHQSDLFQDHGHQSVSEAASNPKDWTERVGFYFWDGTTWVLGPNVRIYMQQGNQGTADQWTVFQTEFYFGHTLISNQSMSAWIEQDPLAQVRVFVDIWYAKINASTTWGMRTNAYYVGMHNSGFWIWANWSPQLQNGSTTQAFGTLFNHAGQVQSATQITCTKVFFNETRFGVPLVHPGQWNFTATIKQFDNQQFNLASSPRQMQGVDTPVYTQPLVPIIQSTSNFLAPLYAAIASISTFFAKALITLGTYLLTNILQKVPGFGPFLAQSTALLVNFFNLFGVVATYLLGALSFIYSIAGNIVAPISIVTTSWTTISGIYTHIFGGVNFPQIIELFVIVVFGISLLEAVVRGDTNWILNFTRTVWSITYSILWWTYLFVKFLVDFIEELVP